MSRRFQFSLGIVLLGLSLCFFCGWQMEGSFVDAALATIVNTLIAAVFITTLSLVYNRKPVSSAYATRKSEFRWSPIYVVEVTILVGLGVFVISGDTIVEKIVATIGLLFACLKVAAHVYVWSKLPPR